MKLFFALSRTKHSIIDIATPAFCALLWLGGFPPYEIIIVGLGTAFAAYTAVYAVNDLMGLASDKEKLKQGQYKSYSVEATAYHHPVAQGMLSMNKAIMWVVIWFLIALIGSYYLNPIIILILIAGGILEIIYCLLLRVTYLRVFISGIVKACGPIAAIFAVDNQPDIANLSLLFLWVFFWEIGGQNIPADWNDIKEDRRVNARTIPITFGAQKTSIIILCATLLTVALGCLLPIISPATLGITYVITSFVIGSFLLILPAYKLYITEDGSKAAQLFDRASFYPLALLILTALIIVTVE